MRRWSLRGISRNIFLLGLVSFFTDLSSQMIFPLLPLYLVSVLGAGALMVGLIEGAAEAIASWLKVVSGYWSDKLKTRKPFVLLGYGTSAFAKPLFALTTSALGVLGVRILERIGKGIRNAPRDAIVAESIQPEYRGSAYGFQRAMDGLGSVGGALLAFYWLPLLGYRNLFLVAAAVGLLAVVVIFFIRENPRPPGAPSQRREKLSGSFTKMPFHLRWFVVTAGIFAFGHFGYAFLLLKGKAIDMPDQQVLLWYVIFYVVYTLFSYPLGGLSDRWGRKRILILGYGLFGVISLVLLTIVDTLALAVIFGLYGLALAAIDASQRAFTVDLSLPEHRATALGFLHMSIGIAALPGGYLAGWLWDHWGPASTFVFGGMTTLAALVMLLQVKPLTIKVGENQ